MSKAICPRCLGGGEVPPPDGSQDGVACPDCRGRGTEPYAVPDREYDEYVDEMNREYWA